MNRLKNNVLKVVLMALLSLVTVINCGKKDDDKEGSGGTPSGGTPSGGTPEKIDVKIAKGSDRGGINITFTEPNKKENISLCFLTAKVGNSNVKLNLSENYHLQVGDSNEPDNSASFIVKSVSDTEVIILVNAYEHDFTSTVAGANRQRDKVKNMKVIGAGYQNSDEVESLLS